MADFKWDDYSVEGEDPKAAAFNWDDHPEVNPQKESMIDAAKRFGSALFRGTTDEELAAQKAQGNGPTELASAGRGLAQGASFGLRDEGAGLLQSPTGALKEIANKFGSDYNDDDVAAYKRERDASRQLDLTAKNANPDSYMGGEISGALATSFVPGLNLAEGAGLAKTIGHAALQGAAMGVGSSQNDSIGDIALDSARGGVIGGGIGGAGYGAAKAIGAVATPVKNALSSIADYIKVPKQRANAQLILDAAKNLGIEVTPGMLDDSGFLEHLESSLAKSPSIFGRSVEKSRAAVADRLASTAENLVEGATNLTPYQVGEKFKSGLGEQVSQRLDPLAQTFDDVAASTNHIPISDRAKDAVTRNINNLDEVALTGGGGVAKKYLDMIPRAQNANQLKSIMTMLNEDIRGAQGADKYILSAIKGKLGKLEQNSIMRGAVAATRESGLDGAASIGRDLVGELKGARKGYGKLAEDLGSVSESARLPRGGGPTRFMDKVEEIPSERIQDKFFNPENNRQLMALQEQFPEQFNLLKSGKLSELKDAAIDNSLNGQNKLSTQKFLNQVRDLNPEAQKMLFPGKTGQLKDLQTVQSSIPRNFNPSGTASELGFKDMLASNIKDIPNAALYKILSSNKGRGIATSVGQIAKEAPESFGRFAGVMQNAAQRGTQAVAATHFILESSNPEYREMMKKLQGSGEQ